MNKQNISDLAEEYEKKAGRKRQKKKKDMKVSGAKVKKLQKLIIKNK